MHIAVAGGTGVVGAHAVAAAERAGHEVTVLSRSRGVDLTTGAGLDLDGVDAVVDATNVVTMRAAPAVEFFRTTTTTLLRAEAAAGVAHHVALSIVGIDRVPLGYYAGKVEQERLVTAGEVPWTILRATQFHEFPAQLLERVPGGPVALVPRMRSATVAASEVGAELARLATQPPARAIREMAGPQVDALPDLVRRLLRSRGTRRLVLPLPTLDKASRAAATGGLLPTGDALRGTQTFDEWLGQR